MINREKIIKFTQSKTFTKTVNYAILLCAFIVGLETVIREKGQLLFHYIDYCFIFFFSTEIVLRIAAEKNIAEFFYIIKIERVRAENRGNGKIKIRLVENGFWNCFDLMLVIISIVGVFTHIFDHPDFIEIGRLFRIFRILRLLEISEQIKEIEKKIIMILPTVFSFALLLIILCYIYSILGMYIFKYQQYDKADFSNLINAMLCMFQYMTLDGWSEAMNEMVRENHDVPAILIQAFFVSFVVFTAIVTFNVFVSVMTSQMEARIKSHIDAYEQASNKIRDKNNETGSAPNATLEELLHEIQELRREVAELKK